MNERTMKSSFPLILQLAMLPNRQRNDGCQQKLLVRGWKRNINIV